MRKVVWLILTLIIVGIIVGSIIWIYAFQKSDLSVVSRKVDYELKSSDLLKNFINNEDSANKVFLDKIILVDGVIDKITEDSLSISVYLKNPMEDSGVMCGFNKSTIDKSKFNPGKEVKIKGLCTGYLMDVVLNKCSLEK